jgi:hypothetical protein
MRHLLTVALFSLVLTPGLALAQPAPPPPGPGEMGPGPDGMGPGPEGHHWKGDWHDHGPDGAELLMKFYAANTTHDGHLTLAQAQAAGLKPIADHFSDIDAAKRGYVTFFDIQAWHLDGMAKRLEAQAAALRAQD